jgi:Polysaccharide deacetylase
MRISGEFMRWLVLLFTCWALATTGTWAAEPVGGAVYFYRSDTTNQYFASQGQSYEQIIKRWRPYLKKYGEHARDLTRDKLLAGVPSGVLILPTAVALDAQERAAILRFAALGGGVLGSGLVGTRDAQGQFVGLDFLHSTFHVRSHGFFPVSDDTFFMPFGDGPVTWPIPAARRMPISNTKDSLLRISAEHEAAVVMDWARSRQTEPHGVMAFDETGKSRVALFSFADNVWPNSKDALLLLDATLAWLRREPQAYKAAWPYGYMAAHLIEMDTEDQFYSAPSFAKHLESEGFKGTFYSLTSEAVRVPDVVRDLIKRGHEIAYHADVHFGFKGDSAEEQELRIRFMKQQMQVILGDRAKEATGFRAPTESYDKTTEILLRKYGLLHHAADESAHEDRLPFFSVSEPGVPPDQALVVLPRTQLDDVNFKDMKLTPEQVNTILNHDLDLTVRSGAFGLLSVHSQNYVEGGLMLHTMGDYIHKVASYRDRLWVARGDEITSWWRQREAVQVDQQWLNNGLQVSVINTNSDPVAGLTVFVTLPGRNASLRVATTPRATAVRTKPVDAFRTALIFDNLPPGVTQLRLTFP